MRQITIEIDAEEYLCGNCDNNVPMEDSNNNICLIFGTALAFNDKQQSIRSQRCLNAEKPQHKIDDAL